MSLLAHTAAPCVAFVSDPCSPSSCESSPSESDDDPDPTEIKCAPDRSKVLNSLALSLELSTTAGIYYRMLQSRQVPPSLGPATADTLRSSTQTKPFEAPCSIWRWESTNNPLCVTACARYRASFFRAPYDIYTRKPHYTRTQERHSIRDTLCGRGCMRLPA